MLLPGTFPFFSLVYMSSNQHKRKASSRSDDFHHKRQRRDNGNDHVFLDEKEEKKEREVKEDITAAALPVNDPDLVVGTLDRDWICSICLALLTDPKGRPPLCSFSLEFHSFLIFLCCICVCGRFRLRPCLLSDM
jgi:hypothetical protein